MPDDRYLIDDPRRPLRTDGARLVASLQKEMQVPGVVQPNSKQFPRLVDRREQPPEAPPDP